MCSKNALRDNAPCCLVDIVAHYCPGGVNNDTVQ